MLDSENELYNANRRYTEVRYTEEYSMYRVLANMGQLLSKQRVVLPADAIAQAEVKSEARLPELGEPLGCQGVRYPCQMP